MLFDSYPHWPYWIRIGITRVFNLYNFSTENLEIRPVFISLPVRRVETIYRWKPQISLLWVWMSTGLEKGRGKYKLYVSSLGRYISRLSITIAIRPGALWFCFCKHPIGGNTNNHKFRALDWIKCAEPVSFPTTNPGKNRPLIEPLVFMLAVSNNCLHKGSSKIRFGHLYQVPPKDHTRGIDQDSSIFLGPHYTMHKTR